jgi:hypothetical protein
MTLVLWIKGQPLVWDVTIALADSYVLKTSEGSGFAAEMACKRKHSKYSSIILSNYIFKGLAFETLGKEAIDFIVIENRLIAESGDSKFPCYSTWKRCKHSGHFSRFRIINGNFCIGKTKMLCTQEIELLFVN